MKITSRNVNGIRAVMKKGFLEWLKQDNADIVCLQETKAFDHQIPAEIKYALDQYNYVRHTGKRPGYAGTAIFFKKNIEVLDTINTFDEYPEFHKEGRVTQLNFKQGEKNIALLNVYFPNGGTRADGTEMLTYKLNFYDDVIKYCEELKSKGFEIIITGDFNICHTEIDIARPKENVNSIGFLPIEREKMSEMQDSGYIDMFRNFNPDLTDHYTWWSYRAGARPRNVGRRLDYFWVSPTIAEFSKDMYHQDQVLGSDHCPVSLELK